MLNNFFRLTMAEIAVLLTCFNRKEKTLKCLEDIFLQKRELDIHLDIFVVDGGSTDGTPETILKKYSDVHVSIHPGLYWAGGMRMAWHEAVQRKLYDYFWLINDDTHLYSDCLNELLMADDFALSVYKRNGIYLGSTKDPITNEFSYGGRKLLSKDSNQVTKVIPDGESYQSCDLGNANIMLVSKDVYNQLGGFCERYTHGIADYDYTLRANRAGIPILVSPNYGGECVNDHGVNWQPQSASLKSRIAYLYSPKGLAYKEYLYYIKKFFPKSYYASMTKLWLKTFLPSIWTRFK